MNVIRNKPNTINSNLSKVSSKCFRLDEKTQAPQININTGNTQ
jgi:hypothetical protein